ncbi:MAG: NADH:flavin oxidoreductase [Candidatus Helarchaeota archaeon]
MVKFTSIIFRPSKIGNLTIKNRVVRSATYLGLAADDGSITNRNLSSYEALAKNNIGLIITGYMNVNKNGKAAPRQLGIHSDFLIDGLKKLVSTVKNYDVTFFAQIAHGGRQIIGSHLKNIDVVAPSNIPDRLVNVIPREMTEEDIAKCVDDFVKATQRAYEAGFDGVQLHCAHGYLLSLFLSPYCNKRTDSYGGSVENRFKIVEDIILGIHDEIDKNFPIIAKLNVSDFVQDEEQLTIDESKQHAKRMVDLGIQAIEPSGGLYETAMYGNLTAMRTKIKTEKDEAYFLPEAKIIKKEIGNVPVILVGGIRSMKVAERVINEKIDFISMSRPFIREPDLITKWMNGISKKSDCISCGRCLLEMKPRGVTCIPLARLKRKMNRLK